MGHPLERRPRNVFLIFYEWLRDRAEAFDRSIYGGRPRRLAVSFIVIYKRTWTRFQNFLWKILEREREYNITDILKKLISIVAFE